MKDETMSGLTQDYSRNLILLNDDDKYKKKNALLRIHSELTLYLKSDNNEKNSVIRNTLKEITPLLTDSNEGIREKALKIFFTVLDESFDPDECISFFVPVLARSLELLQQLDSSEEIRLDFIILIEKALSLSKEPGVYVQELLLILSFSLTDLYPEIKKKTSQVCQLLCNKAPGAFYNHSEMLIEPLCSNLTHQHSKVRLETVKTIGFIMKNSKGNLIENVLSPLTQRLFDPSSTVREAVIQVAGDWLLNLTDRYSYHLRLIPMLLGGLLDEFKSVRQLAFDLWHEVGIKFENENQNDLKDKIDFDFFEETAYPPNYERPNFGCRELIGRTAYKLIPCLVNDLKDWQQGTRIEASGLLPILVVHLEKRVTQHAQILIEGVCKAMIDCINHFYSNLPACEYLLQKGLVFDENDLQNDPELESLTLSLDVKAALRISSKLLESVFILSHFVDLKMWWKLISSLLKQCHEFSSPYSLSSHLFVLVRLLEGLPSIHISRSSGQDSSSNEQLLLEIARYIVSDDMIASQSMTSKLALTHCGLVFAQNIIPNINNSEILSEIITCLYQLQSGISAFWIDNDQRDGYFASICRTFCKEKILPIVYNCDKDSTLKRELNHLLNRIQNSLSLHDKNENKSWHPKSLHLYLLEYALKAMADFASTETDSSMLVEVLPRAMKLLTTGCRLGSSSDNESSLPKSDNSSITQNQNLKQMDPMILASEAELRLRGLVILTKICQDCHVRDALSEPDRLGHTLMNTVLPSCIWRAGRVAESMRTAACTALLALLGSFVERQFQCSERPLVLERHLETIESFDKWFDISLDLSLGVKQANIPKVPILIGKVTNLTFKPYCSKISEQSFLALGYECIKILLTRLSGLMTDDGEETRLMALKCFGQLCLGLGNIPQPVLSQNATWSLSPNPGKSFQGKGVIQILGSGIFPDSVGDLILKFYPNLIKRLDDVKDSVRLLTVDCIIHWINLISSIVLDKNSTEANINPTYRAIILEFLEGTGIYLDDQELPMRLSISRLLLVFSTHLSSEMAIQYLNTSLTKCRCKDLIKNLINKLATL